MDFLFLKIDLKNADPERVENQIEKVFDIPSDECIKVKYFPKKIILWKKSQEIGLSEISWYLITWHYMLFFYSFANFFYY